MVIMDHIINKSKNKTTYMFTLLSNRFSDMGNVILGEKKLHARFLSIDKETSEVQYRWLAF